MTSYKSWDDLAPVLEILSHDSMLSKRIPFLTNAKNLVENGSLSSDQLELLSKTLLETYTLYNDSKSRKSIRDLFNSVLKVDSNLIEYFLAFIEENVTKKIGTKALVDYMNLLDLSNLLLEMIFLEEDLFKKHCTKIIVCHTFITASVEVLLDTSEKEQRVSSDKQNQHRKRIRQTVVQKTTKSLTTILISDLDNNTKLETIKDLLLTQYAKLKIPTAGTLVFVAALTRSSLQLHSKKPSIFEFMGSSFSEPFLVYFGKEVLLGKNLPSIYCLQTTMDSFLTEFVTGDNIQKHLIPDVEKSNLRSPEVSFQMAAEIFSHIDNKKVDILNMFISTKLMTQTFSSFKSSKEGTRLAALSYIVNLLKTLQKEYTSEADLVKVIENIFTNLKSNLNVDYKISISHILREFPRFYETPSVSISHKLIPYVTKESNEAALSQLLNAFFLHYFSTKQSTDELNKVISSGLNDKKLNIKKCWFNEFFKNSDLLSPEISSLFQEVCLEYFKDSLTHAEKSENYNPYYALCYFNHLITQNTENSNITDIISNPMLGFSYLKSCTSMELEAAFRINSVEMLKIAYQKYPEVIGLNVINSVAQALKAKDLNLPDGCSIRYIVPVFNALCTKIADPISQASILRHLLILSQYEGFKIRNGWAGLVINVKMDPALVIAEAAKDIIELLVNESSDKELLDTIYGRCVIKAAAYTSFINPQAIVPLLSEQLKLDLDLTEICKLTEDDFKIWEGVDGEMVFNVLEKKNDKKLSDKNSKDYETLKWEESIRKEQAKKFNQKLSKEDQQLVKEQIQKESEIRARVNQYYLRLSRSLKIIKELSTNAKLVENGINQWFPLATNMLLELFKVNNASKLAGYLAVTVFLQLSENTCDKLENYRLFCGLATLRVYKASNIPDNYTEEDISELVSRVLFRLKIVTSNTVLDSITLTYLLPLLTHVLEEGKKAAIKNADRPVNRTEFIEEDVEEENLLLVMDIISAQSSLFEDPSIPRSAIIKVLLSLLALPSKAKVAKDCFNTLCQSISVEPTKEDLEIILSHLLSPHSFVRTTILEALDNEYELESFMKFSPAIFICRFDSDDNNRELANFIWEFNKFEILPELLDGLLALFNQEDSGLRLFLARAFAYATYNITTGNGLSIALDMLMRFYDEKSKPLTAILDEFGLVVVPASQRKDVWEERSTTAIAFKELSPGLPEEDSTIIDIIKFLVNGPLGDREPIVRQEMKEAGIEIINEHGSKKSAELVPVLESALDQTKDINIKENVIILYGTLARHLEQNDPRIDSIIKQLLTTLDTPSSDVQQAVSACIAPLVFQFRNNAGTYLNQLMSKLLDSSVPKAARKGAAWGIAGIVKGYGISALSEFDIIRNLMEASEDKKDSIKRESVAYAFQNISKSLGKFFEPYVIEVLPNILKNLGDSVPEVRDATAGATKAIMANTTGYGVKKMIPVAVSNLDEIAWRTKRGSVELLGNMAYLDPTQLSNSLSTIVPEIVGVLNDSHKEVRKAADESLKRFGEVIRNPEIQKLVPILLQAIGDPTKHTEEALDALIKTQFVHYIDGPSLALIIHIIHRGMHDRSANTKRKACKIVGNMAILVETKDLIPYLQQLIDEVEIAMVDPVPNTRATAARALGALVERLGEEQFPDLIPRLLDTLNDESKAGDRLGSAQALAEVISGLGLSKLDELLPTILSGATNYRSFIREGFMPLLLFIPICFGAQFAPYINQIIQPILAGLADVDENIRDTSLKAGKLIVKNYATKAIDLLLPELERGVFDENERIRLSSVQLSGELLFQVTGISSRNEFTEESEGMSELSGKMVDVLGQERRDRVLSSLFVCRNDTSGIVRASTVDIWKALVPNTPRTVKEILPVLTDMIVTNLASPSNVLRNIAAQTLGDVVRRVGGNAMAQLLEALEVSLEKASNPDSREGVCIALHELIQSANMDILVEYQETIVNILRKTLVDSDESVRQAAASAFDSYQEIVGKVAVDEVIPYLLTALKSSEGSEYALLGLQDIMTTKSEVIFPILMPTLLASPIDSFRASALGSLTEVAGPALYKRLSVIINSLVNTLISSSIDEQTKEAVKSALDRVFLSVKDDEGLHPLLQQILALVKNENIEKRIITLETLPNFFERTTLDIDVYVPDFVSHSIMSLDDSNERVVKATFEALATLIKKQDKSMLEKLVQPAKQALQRTGKQGEDLAAFALPRGPSCVLPIFLHGLMYGSAEEREVSAIAIADVVSKTPAANLKPFVSSITGPLIRVVGERFKSDVKAAILLALNILFKKIPQFLKPFIPQLQRTFVKSLSDPTNETLRLRAAKAIGTLIEHQPRVDPLVIELVTNAKQTTEEGVKTAMLNALLEVVGKAGNKLNESSKKNIVKLVEEEMLSSNEKLAVAYAKLIGSLSEILSESEAANILREKVLDVELEGSAGKFAVLILNSFLKDAPKHIFKSGEVSEYVSFIINALTSTNIYFAENATVAAGKILLLVNETKSPYTNMTNDEVFSLPEEDIRRLVDELARVIVTPPSNSADQRRLALVVIRTIARLKNTETVKPNIDALATSVFSCVRDIVIPIKLAAEKAYLALFELIENEDMSTFNAWFEKVSANGDTVTNIAGTAIQLRSIGDYTKRVAKRLASVERERITAGGDAEAMFSDRYEDEREIWAVGGVELPSTI
ncbi:Gcn1p [Nakaseomyces bracarensis]|uniref:Gcn1p n=1 Tax=Nakaseomyces bracarensis TaxID=273131 RepID=UPI0038712F5B